MKLLLLLFFFSPLIPLHAEVLYYFADVEYLYCYDGDTCRFNIPNVVPIIGDNMVVRLRDIDTPEIKGKCEAERKLAIKARDELRKMLKGAERIDLIDVVRGKYFRFVTTIMADGINTSEVLIEKGLAVSYQGKKKIKDWCE